MSSRWSSSRRTTTIRHKSPVLLAAVAVVVVSLAAVACGSGAMAGRAVDFSSNSGQASSNLQVGAQLFDDSKVHTISVTFDQAEYDTLITAYKTDGTKEWIEATVIIDGTTYDKAGIRLKGNSSLRGLANGREKGPGGAVSASDPQGLPWLIRLDKYVEGQACDGVSDIVIRSSTWEASLNEAVALELLESAGLASQRAIAVRFTVNGGTTVLRLAVELPDDVWMAQHFGCDGVLYKAEATGDFSYRGTDPEAYDDVFDQEAGKDEADLSPLIEFLDFVNNSDDSTFNSTVAERLDIEMFATYLAMEELIGNSDDIDGPGNNSYLYYNKATGSFTVVPWDHNLAFGGIGGDRDGGPGMGAPGAGRPDARGPGARNKTNALVQRFHANAEFEALYQMRLTEMKARLYENGIGADILASWVNLIKTQASDLVDLAVIDAEAARIAAYFESDISE